MRLRSYVTKRPNGSWRAVYDDPETGRERTRHFRRKVDADQWLDTIRAEVTLGTYIDPQAGRALFRGYAREWQAVQVHRPSTVAKLERDLALHLLPAFGDRRLDAIKPSEVQAWVKGLSLTQAPNTVRVKYRWLATILLAAQHDGLIRQTPCRRIKLPKAAGQGLVVPLETHDVLAICGGLPDDLGTMAFVAAGTGLRQGEMFGLTWDRVDFLRRQLRVDQQLVDGTLSPPKTDASYRTVPLSQSVLDALSVLPRGEGLVFTQDGEPWRRNRFSHAWRPVVADALGLDATFHDLRHYCASLLISQGCSVKTVQRILGHASATITLDTYGHLWPDSEDQVRAAIDAVLCRSGSVEGVETVAL